MNPAPLQMILASASPRRKELLDRLGLAFEVLPADIREEIAPGEEAGDAVLRLAREKAAAVSRRHPEGLIVGADTVVLLDGRIMGKPANAAEAAEMLGSLSGRTHLVQTAVALECPQRGHSSAFSETTAVTFHELDREDIEIYLARELPLDKAGAYGIQDFSGVFVSRIEGCYHNVMGFPLAHFHRHLKTTGLWPDIHKINNL